AYIANPDLLERLEHDLALNQVQFDTLYGADAAGYTDYPVLEKLEA
ncbi:MAG: alkene reductase, partial [Acinetobacter sp.]